VRKVRSSKTIPVTYLSAVLLMVFAPSARAEVLTLEKCVDIAIRNSTPVLQSQNGLDLSAEQLLQGYAAFLPTLDLAGSANYNGGKQVYAFGGLTVVNSNFTTVQYQISTSLNLFNGFADYATYKAARSSLDAANTTLAFAKQQIATDITQSYYQVMLDRVILSINQENYKADKARSDLFNAQLDVGSSSVADASRQEAQSDLDLATVVSSETKLHDDELLLIQKLRVDPKQNYTLEEADLNVAVPALPKSEEQTIQTALDLRPDLKTADSTLSAANFEITVAKADYYPKLNLGADVLGEGAKFYSQSVNGVNTLPAYQNGLPTQLGQQIGYTFALTLTWNLFDRGLTRLNVERARITADNSQIAFDDSKIQVITQVRQVYGDLAAAQRQYDAARTAAIAAKRAYDVILGRYRVQASSFIDLLAAQATLVQARSSEAQAKIGFKFQSKLLEFYEGQTPIQ
jgi:outer membrane protein